MPSRHRGGGCRAGTRSCHKLGGDGAVTSSGDKLGGDGAVTSSGVELSQARGGGAVTSSAGYAGPGCLAGRLADVERMCLFFGPACALNLIGDDSF